MMKAGRQNALRRLGFATVCVLAMVWMAQPATAITQEEVITLSKLGIAPEEIIKAIEKDRTVFDLSVADILALKKASIDEGVLKFMLQTAKRFASDQGGSGASSAPTPNARPEPEVVEETPEERAAREERMRQEALRLKEEQRKQEETQRRAYAEGVLAKGQRLADDGNYVQSIRAFQKFMDQGGFTPDSEEAYLAKFGIANALVKANLYQAAANQLVEILLAGPERPFFKSAFEQLRQLRKKVNYSPPDLEELTRFLGHIVGNYSRRFQDQYHYVLGEFYYDYNNFSLALRYLEKVSPDAPDFAKSQYLKGLVEVRNELAKSAVQSFQRAIVATEENESDANVKDLAYLGLARIAYEIGDYDAAIYYYRKVPTGSYKEGTAFYESGWVYFFKNDYSRALGTFHTLHSPYFNHYFYPELWILEATAYLYMCQFDRAEAALDRYKKDVAPLGIPLKKFLLSTVRPEDYYKAVVATVEGSDLYDLPERLTATVLGNIEFYNLYKTIKQIELEQSKIRDSGANLGAFGQDVATKLDMLRADRVREIGIKIQRILRESERQLQLYGEKLTEIEIDLYDMKIETEEEMLRSLEDGAEEEVASTVDTGGSAAIVGSDQWQWSFEGEYWKEEIGTYRAFVPNLCPPEEER